MKVILLFVFLLVTSTNLLFSDLSISGGSEIIIDTQTDVETHGRADIDLYLPATERISLFLSGSGTLAYSIFSNVLSGNLYFSTDLSIRNAPLLARLRLGSILDTSTAVDLPNIILSTEFLLSAGGFTFSASASPGLVWTLGRENTAWFEGDFEISFLPWPALLLNPLFSGGISLDTASPGYFLSPVLNISFYPSARFNARLEAGYMENISDTVEPLIEYGVEYPVNNYHELAASAELIMFLSSNLKLHMEVPGSITFKDHPAIVDSQLLESREWITNISPSIEVNIFVLRNFRFVAGAGFTAQFSNSDDKQRMYGYGSFDVELNL
jgi:hypothetical protein